MLKIKPHIYLISDSTGETVSTVARSAYARFERVEPEEHKWALIRSERQLKEVLLKIKEKPGLVLYTLINKDLENLLIHGCSKIGVNIVPVLETTIKAMKKSFNKTEEVDRPGKQHDMDKQYFNRIDALQYAVTNDDGQISSNLKEAEIILIGVSRTSKTPTSMYLANKGIKVANVPFVLNQKINLNVNRKKTLLIGLFASPERLLQIRKSRLNSLNEENETNYTNLESVKKELQQARRYFNENKCSTIDVSRKSIEEIAAAVLEYMRKFKETQ